MLCNSKCTTVACCHGKKKNNARNMKAVYIKDDMIWGSFVDFYFMMGQCPFWKMQNNL